MSSNRGRPTHLPNLLLYITESLPLRSPDKESLKMLAEWLDLMRIRTAADLRSELFVSKESLSGE